MTRNDDHLRDADLGPVIDMLRAERPTASALELDTVKRQVMSRVARNPQQGSRRTEFMRSRIAILGMLVLGLVLSTSGAGLAVSGLAGSDKAAVSQYGHASPTPTGGGGVLGEEESGGSMPSEQNNAPSGDTNNNGGSNLQPSRQVESGAQSGGGNELPFTGFAAIPILLGGIALLSVGLVLRRRTSSDS
jgi:hypothetical protein